AAALGADFGGTEGLDRIGSAVAGGHIRLTSFAAPEEEVLRQAGVAGELDAGEEAFPLRVVAQNFGSDNGEGTKLDYWVDRQIDTACDLAAEGGDPEMSCLVTTTLANEVPPGLGEYVGGKPYGVLESLLETYVPQGAEITSVTLDGRPAEAFGASQTPPRGYGRASSRRPGRPRSPDDDPTAVDALHGRHGRLPRGGAGSRRLRRTLGDAIGPIGYPGGRSARPR
ncbi:MAG: hypothetical protein ABI571_01610, partial [Actinomycetota bacterium]